jgi:hypothetical protein
LRESSVALLRPLNSRIDNGAEMVLHKIIIEPIGKPGSKGQRYRASHEGSILVEDSRNPEFAACRALLAKGYTGRVETWRLDGMHPTMQLNIAVGAQLTVIENATDGPRLAKWTCIAEKDVRCRSGRPIHGALDAPLMSTPDAQDAAPTPTATGLSAKLLLPEMA